MPAYLIKPSLMLVACFAMLLSFPASAVRLEIAPESHWILHLGAGILLYTHITGGALGILSGIVASVSKKGSRVHRASGKLFFWSMFICYLIGAFVAPLLDIQQSTNFVAAVLALYLLCTGVSAANRRKFVAGNQEKIGVLVALTITVLGAVFMYLAAQSPDGSLDGSPPQAYILFLVAGGLAVIGDIKALMQKQLSQIARIARHLWRMSMSFFIASGSAFFGQAEFFPDWFSDSLLPVAFGFFPLIILLIYVIKYSWLAIKQKLKEQQKLKTA